MATSVSSAIIASQIMSAVKTNQKNTKKELQAEQERINKLINLNEANNWLPIYSSDSLKSYEKLMIYAKIDVLNAKIQLQKCLDKQNEGKTDADKKFNPTALSELNSEIDLVAKFVAIYNSTKSEFQDQLLLFENQQTTESYQKFYRNVLLRELKFDRVFATHLANLELVDKHQIINPLISGF